MASTAHQNPSTAGSHAATLPVVHRVATVRPGPAVGPTSAAAERPAATRPAPARPSTVRHASRPVRARAHRPRRAAVRPHGYRAHRTPRTLRSVPASGALGPVIAFALAQVGKPYRFASAGPGGYDCSGLVSSAFRLAGIQLPHGTGGILGHGAPVDRADLRPGDVVFETLGHVAIYLGNNQVVEAANSRDGIRVTTMWGFATARRML